MSQIFHEIKSTIEGIAAHIAEAGPHVHSHHADDATHRFGSFAPQRDNCFVKWYIAGNDYFWALSELIDSAKESIYIMGWFISPELYLRRPPAFYPEWRLDKLLKKKAEQGVKVYVIVYEEVPQVTTMNSEHAKKALEALHPNVLCIRHPEHIGLGIAAVTEAWTHHEKAVIIDKQFGTVGGLDVCFGRWDTYTHPLADVHPTEFSRTLFPGQDYNNARYKDFQNTTNYLSNQVSNLEIPRLPWQDLQMIFMGSVVNDLAKHFVERWNFAKKQRLPLDKKYPLLDPNAGIDNLTLPPVIGEGATSTAQVVRSVSRWSHGVPTEASIQNAYIKLINEAQHFVYIENQFFISNPGKLYPVKNFVAKALLDRILKAAYAGEKFLVIVCMPEAPGNAGSVKSEGLITLMAAQWRTINRGGYSIYEGIKAAGFEPTDYIQFFHLRTYDRINAPQSFIHEMEQKSGVSFNEAQVAMARQWLGPTIDPKTEQESIKISVLVPKSGQKSLDLFGAFEGSNKNDDTKVVDFALPKSEEEARQTIAQFESGAPRSDKDVSDSIGQHAQSDTTTLESEKWLGSEQEELDCFVSETVYIHSKLMIVDDRAVIMGSANLNDRSLRGDGDSEIAVVVEDTDMIPSTMDGKAFMVSRFAATLRRKLFKIHLGLVEPQIFTNASETVTSFMRPPPFLSDDEINDPYTEVVADPLSTDFQRLWNNTARKNTEVYVDVFKVVPNDTIKTWDAYKKYVPDVKVDHVANPNLSAADVKERLGTVKGHLIEMPLQFLIDQRDAYEGIKWDRIDIALPYLL